MWSNWPATAMFWRKESLNDLKSVGGIGAGGLWLFGDDKGRTMSPLAVRAHQGLRPAMISATFFQVRVMRRDAPSDDERSIDHTRELEEALVDELRQKEYS